MKCKNNKILKKIMDKGKKVKIDDDSKIAFISDVHRGDGSNSDALRLNRNIYKAALKFYYNKDYMLIELGDGDELWKNKSFKNIAYNYKDIFKILNRFNKEDRLCMIYGNHDIIKSDSNFVNKTINEFKMINKDFGTEMIKLYSNIEFYESIILEYKKNYIIGFHGHQADYINCNLWKISRFFVRYIWRNMENIAGFKEPTSPSSNYNKGDKIDKILENIAKKEKQVIVCGHTHNDIFAYPGQGYYFNDGCCVFPSAITAIEMYGGKIALIKWSMEVNEKNYIFINRSIIGGPCSLDEYFNRI